MDDSKSGSRCTESQAPGVLQRTKRTGDTWSREIIVSSPCIEEFEPNCVSITAKRSQPKKGVMSVDCTGYW